MPNSSPHVTCSINDSVGKFQIHARFERECHSHLSLGNQFPNRVINWLLYEDSSINRESTDKSALYYSGSRFLLLRAWQPQAAKPAAKNLLRTTEGGEESASLAPLFSFGHLFFNFGVTHVNAWIGENVKLVTART